MNWLLVLGGLLVHLVFFYSIFDIYFTSPIVHGMTPHRTPLAPPAKRLILFVTDGLRADKLFGLDSERKTRAPYLRNIITSKGAWGVSHTRVPTESRPGHVALIAGFYEDVSAVAKGWKENPVEFDSVFNESRYTWSWGSPDILPMFSKGATGDHVFIQMYPAESEDFAGADSSLLDTWVFDSIKDFLLSSKNDEKLRQKLNSDKVIFFAHLLGLDTNGHAHRPYSEEYLANIETVDKGVEEIVNLFDEYYDNDNQTAYVLSADHGMTNWGSHGAGHPDETLTPLIAWGAGVRGPNDPKTKKTYNDGFEKDWGLEDIKRSDVNQADVSPLMASLVGVPFPLNSVGTLPLDYLENTEEYKAESIFANAKQIVEQFEIKMRQRRQTSLLFTPFDALTPSMKVTFLRTIHALIKKGQFKEAIGQSHLLIKLALKGLNYYHNYDRFFLGISIASGFLGWMLYVCTLLISNHTHIEQKRTLLDEVDTPFFKSEKGIRIIFIIIGIVVAFLLFIQSLPWTYYLYCLVPVILWHKVTQRLNILEDLRKFILDCGYVQTAGLLCFFGAVGLEIIVTSFFYRELLSVGLVAMALYPLFTPLRKTEPSVVIGWTISCLFMAVFPLMPVVGRDANYNLVFLAGILSLIFGIYASAKSTQGSSQARKHRLTLGISPLTCIQLSLVLVSVFISKSTASSIAKKEGLPLFNQMLSWLILGSSFVLPTIGPTQVLTRLLSIGLAFMPPYILLSTAHEGLFCVMLSCLMLYWIKMEEKLAPKTTLRLQDLDFKQANLLGERQRHLILGDLRCCYFFIFFLITAFFGTGNIASINSFDPASVYCFLTVFNPFVMGALMMWKILIPFMMVCCTFNAIHVAVNVPTQSLFLLVLLMSDFMAMHFFFLVKDYGSWLEIGTSISHYVIVMAMICFLLLLLGLSKIFTNYQLPLKVTKKTRSQ